MKNCFFVVLLIISGIQTCFTQGQNIQFIAVDQSTLLPISDAHVFINNASFGTNTDDHGMCNIQIPSSVSGDLVLSHIAYDTKILHYDDYHHLTKFDTIKLFSNGIDLSQIEVQAKRSRKWKRHFKKFRSAFLGNDQAARKCKILNPEVLRFYTDQNEFRVEALDQIVIRNDFLMYEIDFVLKTFNIKNDGSVRYFGYANYRDISNQTTVKSIHERRKAVYKSSPRHFYSSLIHDNITQNKYQINKAHYKSSKFETGVMLERDDILKYDSVHNVYLLTYDAYLQITNFSIKDIVKAQVDVRSNGLESQKYGGTQSGGATKIEYATSQLYKISPVLFLDPMGNLLNSKEVQEFGFWSNQRMSHALPFNYASNFSQDALISKIPKRTFGYSRDIELFKDLIYNNNNNNNDNNNNAQEKALSNLKQFWKPDYFAPLLDIVLLSTDKQLVKMILEILHFNSDQNIVDYYSGLQWLWRKGFLSSIDYANFKADIYQYIDPKFKKYFEHRQDNTLISLNEIMWGGVKQDGIPPLKYPKFKSASKADHMSDEELVFGIKIGDDIRAYPKRIIGWHEFVVDSIGGQSIAIVYCTLCGTVIAYNTTHKDIKYNLGTSGFLFRSNKLMYDKKTQSLWSTIEGKPVLGPLTNKNIELHNYPIVSTTWKEWKAVHPSSKVLSEETGFDRNYEDGAAYKSYYSTDNLMFPVALSDKSLDNKDEVFVIKSHGYQNDPVAISLKFLNRHSIFMTKIVDQNIVILTNKHGTSRAYEIQEGMLLNFKRGRLKDQEGHEWKITEDALISTNGAILKRINSHNIFWFAWYNVFPDTRLIK